MPRIVIRAFTCRRDVATAELLACVLNRLGCNVLVCSMRDFNRTLRLWKPHVAVVNTPGEAVSVRKIAPGIGVVWLDGEGFLPPEAAHAITFTKNLGMFRAIDLALVWGEKVRDELCAAFPNENTAKIHAVGNPTYDLIRYRGKARGPAASRSIGFVMRSGTINNHSGIPPTRTLPNFGNLDRVIVECQSFVGSIECARRLLEHTDYELSFRPHPLEQLDSYHLYKDFWFDPKHRSRVSIDESLSFSHWAANQRAILSPTSATLLEAYLLNVPVINIDAISGTEEFNQDYCDITKTWQDGGVRPRNFAELLAALNSADRSDVRVAALDRQLSEYCNYSDHSGSACLAAARLINGFAQSRKPQRGMRLSAIIVDAIDAVSFRTVCRKNPLHPNMNYRRGYHQLPDDLDRIADNILRSGPASSHRDSTARTLERAKLDA